MEKINIYVPDYVGAMIENDAEMFEVYKKDGKTVNKNRFLSLLIKGYYEDYISEARTAYNSIISSIKTDKLTYKDKEEIADTILKNTVLPIVPARKGKNPARLSLKPTKDTEALIDQIFIDLGGEDYISQYFCRMIMSYCGKPFSKREQIIFKDKYEILKAACSNGRSVSFKTIWNDTVTHTVIPYKVAIGPEEMFNYLVGAEINNGTSGQKAKSFRLNRISTINYSRSMDSIDDTVKRHLDMMLKFGPQYMINDDTESCVRLSDQGVRNYGRIYYGRPVLDHVVEKGDGHYYYFKCSKDQLFFYFRRFGYEDAEIISPESLRQRMIDFHSKAYTMYRG